MTSSTRTVAVIGAGPYGLAAAAHLGAAGVETRVFGQAMDFWQVQMPVGMLLRSSWEASHISDPRGAWTLEAYQSDSGERVPTPIPLDQFVRYGLWFQRRAAPDLDTRRVVRVEPAASGFRLQLEDGDSVSASRVVVATGIGAYPHRPAGFGDFPSSLVSHSADQRDLGAFAGKRVLVVGGGQSALESAVLLREGGAEVEVVMRASQPRWLRRSGWLHALPTHLRSLFYPPTDVGPPGLNLIVAAPDVFRRLPRSLQDRIASRSIRPAGAGWLVPRTSGVRLTAGRRVVSLESQGGGLSLTLDDASSRQVDHLLLATGYRVELSRAGLLPPELLASIQQARGYPVLENGLESSIPGLHFVGAAAAWSFGPLMRFVSGTAFAAKELTRFVRRSAAFDPVVPQRQVVGLS
jgi:hypothetical protein